MIRNELARVHSDPPPTFSPDSRPQLTLHRASRDHRRPSRVPRLGSEAPDTGVASPMVFTLSTP